MFVIESKALNSFNDDERGKTERWMRHGGEYPDAPTAQAKADSLSVRYAHRYTYRVVEA